jgi:hypothetical protein
MLVAVTARLLTPCATGRLIAFPLSGVALRVSAAPRHRRLQLDRKVAQCVVQFWLSFLQGEHDKGPAFVQTAAAFLDTPPWASFPE